MRITQLYDSYQVKGGVERVLSVLLNAWARRGHDVSLLVRGGAVSTVYPLLPTVSTFSLDRPLQAGQVRRLLGYARDIPALRRHPAICDADVVIANGPWCSLLAILALKLLPACRRRPVLIVCDHNNPAAFGWLTRVAGRRLYGQADCILALTGAQRDYYRKYVDTVRVIANPIAPAAAEGTPCRAPSAMAEQFLCNPPALVESRVVDRRVLAVGRLHDRKGFHDLLDAWAVVVRQMPDAHLILVGEGERKTALHAQAERLGILSHITFAPFTDDMASVYRTASILVMSSRHEGLPLVLLEAQSYGLPIVSFDCEFGPREVITHGVDGLLCEPGDVQALAQGLLQLLDNEEEREAMSQAALVAAQRYALPEILDQWDALFADLAARTCRQGREQT